mgnify:CR=1 FL=1
MNRTFNLLFFIKKNKIKSDGTAPIYLRITIDGVPKEISAKRSIHPDKWDNKLQKVSGNSIETKSLNAYLKTLEQQEVEGIFKLSNSKIHQSFFQENHLYLFYLSPFLALTPLLAQP